MKSINTCSIDLGYYQKIGHYLLQKPAIFSNKLLTLVIARSIH